MKKFFGYRGVALLVSAAVYAILIGVVFLTDRHIIKDWVAIVIGLLASVFQIVGLYVNRRYNYDGK